MKFPKNPPDKTIFEATPGDFYQFDAGLNSWTRMQGYATLFEEATPLRDGIMPASDLRKINGLLLPPPRTTLTSDNCGTTFEDGTFGFRSSTKELLIDTALSFVGKDADGNKVEKKEVWKIHENTYGINFRIDLPMLVNELDKRGKLTYHKTVGVQGKKGQKGDKGIDKLETGPQGVPGVSGKNLSFLGALIADANNSALDVNTDYANRAVVDVYVDQFSPEENHLVVTRANIGSVDSCPSLVKPKNIKSKWIVVADERQAMRRVIETCNPIPQCGRVSALSCGTAGVTKTTRIVQNFCSTRLYYIDMEPIEADIRERYEVLLEDLKIAKQTVAEKWVQVMIDVFNEQKLAVCCALENCESKRENQKNRQYLEQQRMAGAAAGVSLKVSCDESDRNYANTVSQGGPGAGQTECPVPPTQQNRDITPFVSRIEVDAAINSPTEEKAVSITLAEGTYSIESASCAIYSSDLMLEDDYLVALKNPDLVNPTIIDRFKAQKPYTCVFTIIYQSKSGKSKIISNDLGSFRTLEEASKVYAGNKITINHSGGELKAYFAGGSLKNRNSGKIQLFIRKQSDQISRSFFGDCEVPLLEIDISCHLNFEEDNAIAVELAAGDYIAEIDDCCCQVATTGELALVSGYSGLVALKYKVENGEEIMVNPNLGVFSDVVIASQHYHGNSFSFSHIGGVIKVWSAQQGSGNGSLRVAIRKKNCFEKFDRSGPLFGQAPANFTRSRAASEFTTCQMSLGQLMFYEGGWSSKACCGALVDIGGAKWLIIKRSIGDDTSCGGGENAESDCIKKSIPFGFHPAIAYQTIDGKSFFGKPTSGTQTMFRDPDLEQMLLDKIAEDKVLEKVGDPKGITAVLFPFEIQ